MERWMRSRWVWMCVLAATGLPVTSGCAPDCTQLKKDFQGALQSESPFVAPPAEGERPIHFGIAVRDELLNEVVDRALRAGLEKALTFSDGISLVTGQKVGLSTEGKIADVGLYPDKACDECLRVDGRLGGSLTIKLPVLGAQKVPLSGSFSVVAPVKFGPAADGKAAVLLDLSQAAALAKSSVKPEVTQLPPTWWKVIEAPLSKLMVDAVTRDLGPVTLFTFDGLDLGIAGLEVTPVKIVSDYKRSVVFAGFTTNLASDGATLEPRTDLGKNDDLAIGIDRRLLASMTVAMLKSGKLSRTWTKDGKESPDGPISITNPAVMLTDATAGPQPYELSFRAWKVPESGKCWWAQTQTLGTVDTTEKGEVRVGVSSIKITDSSLPGVFETVANWKTSQLVGKSAHVLTKTLNPAVVNFPGSAVSLSKTRLDVVDNAAWLLGSVAVKDSANTAADDDEADD